MKWNRSLILANVKSWATAADKSCPEIKSADGAVAFIAKVAETLDIPGLVTAGEVDEKAVRDAWDRKTVRVIADAGEDVVIEDGLETEEFDSEDDPELKSEGDPEDEVKAYRQQRKSATQTRKSPASSANGLYMKSVERAWSERGISSPGSSRSAASYDRMAERKRYERKAANGETAHSCVDIAEFAGAFYRLGWLSNTKHANYSWRDYDTDVVTKAGSVYDNALGGYTVPEEFSNEMIELKAQFGVAQQIVGTTTMNSPKFSMPRFGDDVVVYKTSENQAMTESDMSFSQVTLLSEEIAALSLQPNRLINLSPISVADTFSRSAARATGKFIDDAYFNGANGFEGLATKVGATSSQTVTSATAFKDATLDDLLAWKSKLPAYTDQFILDDIVITCTRPVFEQVFRKYALAQPGSSMEDLLAAGELRFDGHPIILNNSMARSFSNGVTAAYIGPMKHVTKIGELLGSLRIDSSDQRYFERNQMAFRAVQEVAINCHDVNNTTESGVIGLKYTT